MGNDTGIYRFYYGPDDKETHPNETYAEWVSRTAEKRTEDLIKKYGITETIEFVGHKMISKRKV